MVGARAIGIESKFRRIVHSPSESGCEPTDPADSHDLTSSLGSRDRWPQALRVIVDMMLGSNQPMFVVWGPERVVVPNDAFLALVGADRAGARARALETVWRDFDAVLRPRLDRAFSGQPSCMREASVSVRRLGSPTATRLDVSLAPVRDERGEVGGVLCICTDVDAAIRESEERLRLAAEAADIGLYEGDPVTLTGFWSDRLKQIVGLAPSPEPVPGTTIIQLCHPDDAQRVQDKLMASVDPAGDGRLEDEHRLVRSDGEVRWVYVKGATRFEGEGPARRPVRAHGAVIDITERKRAEEALRASEERFRLVTEAMHGVVYDHDLTTGSMVFSRGLSELIGIRREDFPPTSASWIERIEPADREEAQRRLAEAVAAHAPSMDAEYRVRHADGRLVWVWDRYGIVYDDGRPRRIVGHVSNIDERKRADEHTKFLAALHPMLMEEPRSTELVRRTLERLVGHLAVNGAYFGELSADLGTIEIRACEGPLQAAGSFRTAELFSKEALRTFASESVLVVGNVTTDPRTAHHAQTYLRRDVAGFVVVQVVRPSGWRAIVAVVSQRPCDWRPDEIRLLREVSDLLVSAVDRARAQEALGASERRLALAMEANDAGAWETNLTTGENIWDTRTAALLKIALEDLPEAQQRWLEFVHPDDRERVLCALQQCAEHGDRYAQEFRVVRTDGQIRWFENRGIVVTDPNGARRMLGMTQDITDRKLAEEALRESERRFRKMADTAPAMLWTDEHERCTFLSRGWYEFTGMTEEEALGLGWADAIHPDDRDEVLRIVLDAERRGQPYAVDYRLRRADGAYRWVNGAGRPCWSDTGELTGFIGSVIDVHERKLAEEALREADRRKDEYLAMLGHELRNPLSAVRTATELLKLTGLHDPRLQRIHGVLERQTSHMAALIDGLLEVSRIARGKIHLEEQVLDVREILERVIVDRSAAIQASGLELQTRFPDEPLWVSADPVRLVQVFDNLLANALKFTKPPGSLRVSLERDGDQAVARVRDTGVGIRSEMLSRIFEPFQQDAPQDTARAAGGLGLGLALAKGLVELHRGTITAYSEGPGTGAEFVVRLPLALRAVETEHHDARAAGASTLRAKRILLVEDNVDAASMLRDLLELEGHHVETASNAPDALVALRREKPDLVLCDIGLPGMNGYELARTIRADESLRDIALVAVTGYGQPVDRKRTKEAGFDEHLTKPLALPVLDEVLARYQRDGETTDPPKGALYRGEEDALPPRGKPAEPVVPISGRRA